MQITYMGIFMVMFPNFRCVLCAEPGILIAPPRAYQYTMQRRQRIIDQQVCISSQDVVDILRLYNRDSGYGSFRMHPNAYPLCGWRRICGR